MKLKKRVIVVIFYRNGRIVQSYNFSDYRVIGNSNYILKRVNEWDLDELVYIDISSDNQSLFLRKDIPQAKNLTFRDAIEGLGSASFAPLTVGGKIKSIEEVYEFLHRGADKVIINSALFENTGLAKNIINTFGSQVLMAAVDYRQEEVVRVYTKGAREKTEWDLKNWLYKLQDIGVGEILLNSIDKDGTKSGFDLKVVNEIPPNFEIPVILLGGAGSFEDFRKALSLKAVHSVAAGNFFLHEDQSYYNLKKQLIRYNVSVRNSELYVEKMKKDEVLH